MGKTGNFQTFVQTLLNYWTSQGCVWSQPYDAMMGAGTFHPHTFFRGLGSAPWRSVYVQPCRRPVDGRYGQSPYRLGAYYQLQVLLKPAPGDVVDLFLGSLEAVGIELKGQDVCLLEDNWKGPTLGAWGQGWEVRASGQEVTQFTYFQQLGGVDVASVAGEITYGLERLYMYASGIRDVAEIPYGADVTYGELFAESERQHSVYGFEQCDPKELSAEFVLREESCARLAARGLYFPAFDETLRASHVFNLLDARGALSVGERARLIGRVRDCARACAQGFLAQELPPSPRAEPSQDPLRPFSPVAESGDLLVELGVEEMPPEFLASACHILQAAMDTLVATYQVTPRVLVSSRRILLEVRGLPGREPQSWETVFGPPVSIGRDPSGALTAAGRGFAHKCGVEPGTLGEADRGGTRVLTARRKVGGGSPAAGIAEGFLQEVRKLPMGIAMRWDQSPEPFVRPVRWLLALWNTAVIPLQAFGLRSGRTSWGQRILCPEPFDVPHASQGTALLAVHMVEVDPLARRTGVQRDSLALAAACGGQLVEDAALLAKAVFQHERPTAFLGRMDPSYLGLPRELILSVLREHLFYFAVEDAGGELLPFYVGVASYPCQDMDAMVRATQAVVAGRLEDGAFYFEQDLKTPLPQLLQGTQGQEFHRGLGTLADKVARMERAGSALLPGLGLDPRDWSAAVGACKADLLTGCVREFPDEMQGRMGGLLARHQGWGGEAVARAIEDQYLPAGPKSPLPGTRLGVLLSLVDKADSLVGLYWKEREPTGNRDPYGLRRLSLGILRLLGLGGEEGALGLSLEAVLEAAYGVLPGAAGTQEALRKFILGRVSQSLRADWPAPIVDAALGASAPFVPGTLRLRCRALGEMTELGRLATPFRRCKNLALPPGFSPLPVGSLVAAGDPPEQRTLEEALLRCEQQADRALETQKFGAAFAAFVPLGPALDAFLEQVLVNDPDPAVRERRLSLLWQVRTAMERLADFSRLQ